jgi:hypothetical protein
MFGAALAASIAYDMREENAETVFGNDSPEWQEGCFSVLPWHGFHQQRKRFS